MYHEEYQNLPKSIGVSTNVDNNDNKIQAYFSEMAKPTDAPYSEYLHRAHALSGLNRFEDRTKDHGINLADFLPEPRSLSQVLKIPSHTKEEWEEAIRAEITGLFDSGIFSLNKGLHKCLEEEIA